MDDNDVRVIQVINQAFLRKDETMSKVKAIKIAGILAAILTGGVTIANGNMVEGLGIIAAAFGSASLSSGQGGSGV